MKTAYVDSSVVVASLMGEKIHSRATSVLESLTTAHAADLLEAEVFAALAREKLIMRESVFNRFSWVRPNRRLTGELQQVFAAGGVRGADGWHLAVALYCFGSARGANFLTVDETQKKVAKKLGFQVL